MAQDSPFVEISTNEFCDLVTHTSTEELLESMQFSQHEEIQDFLDFIEDEGWEPE